jgi:hypothetical protein
MEDVDENAWPKDPSEIYMIEFQSTGDEDFDQQIHKDLNKDHIKMLLREKVITHPNQLSWYDPDVFHIHPSFYAHHKN